MFVDTAKVKLQAGKGGDGAVSFRHEIYIPKGGPDGGDGGKGGSIIFKADKDTNTLIDFRFNPELKAENGKNGSGQRSAGRSGKDLIVEVPVGTVVRCLDAAPALLETIRSATSEVEARFARNDGTKRRRVSSKTDERPGVVIADLTFDGQTAIVARGGDGGFGNAHFKSSTRQAPLIAEVGEPGDEFEAEIELKLIADVGLVGLPNAGKSTFLSVVSNARPEIADYPFTTLTPQLGVATIDARDILIADIPGLIEGAADGKGLGHDFLRHVDRTAVLLHLVDVYNDDAGAAYRVIRQELERYSDLRDRPEIVALTKCEGVDSEIIEMQMASVLAVNPDARIFAISAAARQGITELLRELVKVSKLSISSRGTRRSDPSSRASRASCSLVSSAHPREDIESSPDNQLSRSRSSGGSAEEKRDDPATAGVVDAGREEKDDWLAKVPIISLSSDQLANSWKVEKLESPSGAKFLVTGPKIEKFARRTDLGNYASVNRLRDIMKKLGIRAELTSQGAAPDSVISIAGKEFTLVEE